MLVPVARYDAMDESMVYVWLAEGGDMEGDHASDARMLDVIVKCEDGTVMTGMDQYGDPTDSIQVAAPGMVTMIDPTMGAVGDATACARVTAACCESRCRMVAMPAWCFPISRRWVATIA